MGDVDTEVQHRCEQERRIRQLERDRDDHAKRLHEGDMTMLKLSLAVDRFTAIVDRLEKRLDAQDAEKAKGNPTTEKIKDALISWGVPVAVVMILWLAAASGAIPGISPSTPGNSPAVKAHP
jgi:hypothetical protein